jgi:serine/threonine-protein kinase
LEGRTLGSYQIVERLGAGGQGHVYRAVDTTLDREIAIKVLPAAFVADPARLKQFQQEAKLLAAASHPNIAAIYAIEEFEEVRFFTQELVPGRTLARLIEAGPMDLEDTLEIARQVAAALEMAHERRLIHRDLKPSNIMVKPDGGVKVLDFGLALPVDREDDDEDYAISESTPTISRTADSIIVGTAPYMSPDQARGRMVDQRTDIWSFGCVIYECLTGSRPFKGETLLDTLSAIVRSEPDWDALPAATPRRLRDLLRRCLRKRVSDRIQHIGDARIVIEEILENPLPTAAMSAAGSDAQPAPAARRNAWPWAIAAALGGLVLGAAAVMWTQQGPTQPPLRLAVMLDPARLDFDNSTTIAISPDGTGVVYAARDGDMRLYYSALDAFEPVPIEGTEGARDPFFSPDGQWVGFFSRDFKLAKVPLSGGVIVPICDVPVTDLGATWLEDDTIVYATFSTGAGLMQVPASGGEPQSITELSITAGDTNHAYPSALPGQALLFTVQNASGSSVAVLDLETGERRTVIEVANDARYVSSGHLLFAQQGALLAVPFDIETREVAGTPRPVVDDLFGTEREATAYAVSATGVLVYAPGGADPRTDRFVWVDRTGNVEPLGLGPGSYGHPRLSPDGTQLAYDSPREGGQDIWVYDIGRLTQTRLTSEGDNVMPVWTPDGSRVMFAASGHGLAPALYWHRADGQGEISMVWQGDHSLWPLSYQQESIAFYELNPETGRDIWTMTVAEGQPTEPAKLQASRFNERSPMLSPDARWVAYVSNQSGRDEVYVKGLYDENLTYTISNGGGREPLWSADGREIFYRDGDFLMVVPVISGNTLQVGSIGVVFQGVYKRDHTVANQYYDISPDGRRFLMIEEDASLRGPDRLHVIVGFGDELRRLDAR